MSDAEADEGRAFDRRAIPAQAREGWWQAADGHAIRRIDWDVPDGAPAAARGSLLFMPGRGDAYEKYLESLAYWHARGWRATAADWRGQGGSGRLGADAVTGHIDDFALWVDDLAGFWADWRARTPAPHVFVGHSMGGHLALRALAECRIDPAAAVLVAPMLGLSARRVPPLVQHAAAAGMRRLGDPRRPAWKWGDKPGALPADRSDLLTHDPDRYADEGWWRAARPELVMGPGSWGWMEQAIASMRRLTRPGVLEGVATPVQMLATTIDRLVDYRAIARAVDRLPAGELVSFGAEARHEILRESDPVRQRALSAIDEFLARMAPAQAR